MSQNIDTYPLLPASQEDSPVTPPVVVAVPVAKSRGRPKKPVTEEEKAAAEAAKATKEAEKKAKEEEKAKKEAEKAAEKAAKEAKEAAKDANKKPRGRPKKESPTIAPTVPTHNPADIVEITHLKEDVASDASIIVALRAEIAALKEENARFSEIISSVCALVSL
jgi:membrane protein involved in colicin uptake